MGLNMLKPMLKLNMLKLNRSFNDMRLGLADHLSEFNPSK